MIILNALKRSCSVFVPWRRQALSNGSLRRMCSKPADRSSEPHTNHTTQVAPGDHGFSVPAYKPTDFDKKILIWSGRFKTKEQIPEEVSFVMIDTARNRVRVKVCYVMIAMTLISCLGMVYLGKQAVGRHESLASWNMEKKAQWREEANREREAIATDKAQ